MSACGSLYLKSRQGMRSMRIPTCSCVLRTLHISKVFVFKFVTLSWQNSSTCMVEKAADGRPNFFPKLITQLIKTMVGGNSEALGCWSREEAWVFGYVWDSLAKSLRSQLTKSWSKRRQNQGRNGRLDALQWTTSKDDQDDTCLEIATVLERLPNHLSAGPLWCGGSSSDKEIINQRYEVDSFGCTFLINKV